MEARELAEEIKDALEALQDVRPDLLWDGLQTRWGYGDADFFLDLGDEGTFVVTVTKVAE